MSLMCTICDQSLAAAAILETPCNGRFHERCLKDWCKTELACPACSGEQEDCRRSCVNREMNEFPKVCSRVEVPSVLEEKTAETTLGAAEVGTSPEDTEQKKAVQELFGEFAELATSQQAVADRFERMQQRFAEVLGQIQKDM